MEGTGEGRGRRGPAWVIKKNEKYARFPFMLYAE